MIEEIRIRGLAIPVDLPDLTPLEKATLISEVENRLSDLERQMGKRVVDTARLALLTALTFAEELQRLRDQVNNARHKEESKIDDILATLEGAFGRK